MNRTQSVSRIVLALAAGAAVLSIPGPAFAINYYLKATAFSLADPNGGSAIPMWGYVLCQDSAFSDCAVSASAPGPALTVPANETTLHISLSNELPVPTSLVINGLIKPMTPVWDSGVTGNRQSTTARVRSFDAEASAGGGIVDYTWTNVKAGTYLYQSGTQPQVQVQMGLYGALSKNQTEAVTGTPALAYPGVAYDNQATLLYSEIDPALHTAVDNGSYGTAPGLTSTFNYAPRYFLINGQPYPNANSVVRPVGNSGRTLLRLLNAGLTTHVPMLQGNFWSPVAEDGKPYAYATTQYTALLPAAKTMDVVLVADAGGAVYPVIDRRLNLSNNGLSDGGMLTQLAYGAAGVVGGGPANGSNVAPTASNDSYNSVKGVTLSVGEVEGVLSNDSDTDSLPLPIRAVAASGLTTNGGSFVLNANGSFVYTPLAGSTASTDTFSYRATDGLALSNPEGTVTINLTTPSAPATLATLDLFERADSTNLGSSWSQAANTVAGADVQLVDNAAAAVNSNLGGLAIWNAGAFAATQGAQFVLGTSPLHSALVLKASGGTDKAPANYVRVRYEHNNNVDEIVIATMIGGNNISVYVKQAAFPAILSSGDTLTAVVDAKGLVTVFKGSDFVGGVQLPDVATWKGIGRIGIQLQTSGARIDSFKGGAL